MNLASVIGTLTRASWVESPQELIVHQGKLVLTKKESRGLLDDAQQAIMKGDQREAANRLYAGLLLDEQQFLASLQKRGVLRISRCSYATEPLSSIVSDLVTPGLGLSQSVTEYLQSVANLYVVARRILQEYQELRAWLDREREVGIKSALAWLDFTFLKATVGIHETSKRHVASRHPFFFDVEELAGGLSSLLALYGNEFGPLTQCPAINEQGLLAGHYLAVLISASHLAAFRDWEFQVDRQGYRLVPTGHPNAYRLVHPSPEFHRSVELGFIQTSQQRRIKTLEWAREGGKSFHDFAPKLMAGMEDAGLIRLIEKPTARFRFDFPLEILQLTAGVQELFIEETINLAGASRDLLTPPQELLDFTLDEHLTFRDLFLVSRLFQFIRSISAAKLIPEFETRPGLVLQSIVPVFQHDTLVALLSTCVSRETAEAAIRMWSTDVTGHVDMQYQPLIPAGGEVLLPANVFANTNIYRNPLVVIERRLYEDGRVDPLVTLLETKFKELGHHPRAGFEYDLGEIDLLVFVGGILFALECKNSLVPSGPHELMTSLDYLRTAGDQLERFRTRMLDPTFLTWLSKETGWRLDGTTHLTTGIVLSNRMFMGLREKGHPVRGAYDLEHFLADGTYSMGEETHRFWLGDALTGEDLRRYFEDDLTYQPLWACLRGFEAEYQFDGLKVFIPHLYLDSLALADHFGFEGAKQGLMDQQAEYTEAVTNFSLGEHYKAMYGGGANPAK